MDEPPSKRPRTPDFTVRDTDCEGTAIDEAPNDIAAAHEEGGRDVPQALNGDQELSSDGGSDKIVIIDPVPPVSRQPSFSTVLPRSATIKREHSKAEWDAMRDVIKKYYIDKDYTLTTVMDILSKEPWEFLATRRMFKTQFKRWGPDFEKNMNEKRLGNLLRAGTITEGVRKLVDMTRIDKYLKRTKQQTGTPPNVVSLIAPCPCDLSDDVPIQELPDQNIILEMMDTSPCAELQAECCEYMAKGPIRFRIVMDELESSNDRRPITDDTFEADSWGFHQYHDLSSRSCIKNCPCRQLIGEESHAFSVVSHSDKMLVTIHSSALWSVLCSVIGDEIWHITVSGGMFQVGMGAKVDGINFLRHYNTMRSYLASSGLHDNNTLQDFRLFVTGFLEDGAAWYRYGWTSLRQSGVIDDDMLEGFQRQKMIRDIQMVDSGFKAEDRHAGKMLDEDHSLRLPSYTHIEDSVVRYAAMPCALRRSDAVARRYAESALTKTYEGPSIYATAARPVSKGKDPERLRLDGRSSALHLLPDHDDLVGYRDASSFYRQIPQDQPVLPPIIPGSPSTGLRSTIEHNSHCGSGACPAELPGEWHQPTVLNAKLLEACRSGATKYAQTLLSVGADPNAYQVVCGRKSTPMIEAIENNKEEIVRILIKKQARLDLAVTLEDGSGVTAEHTPLLAAVRTGNKSMVQLLLDHGADLLTIHASHGPSSRTMRTTALGEAAKARNGELFKLLLLWDTTFGIGLKQAMVLPEENSTLARRTEELITASMRGKYDEVVELLRTGADVNAISFRGTALGAAAREKKDDVVKLLLRHGADVQLAALCLSRFGLPKFAEDLVKREYGGGLRGFQNLRAKFIRQYKRLSTASHVTAHAKLKAFKTQHQTYHGAWTTGIEVMKRICRGDAPTQVSDTVAFLGVARAMAETLAGEGGCMTLIDKFDNDLLRWQQLFAFEEDLVAYRDAARSVWGVQLDDAFFLDSDFEDQETLDRFRELITTLLEAVREPLGSYSPSDAGLEACLSRRRQRAALAAQCCCCSLPSSSRASSFETSTTPSGYPSPPSYEGCRDRLDRPSLRSPSPPWYATIGRRTRRLQPDIAWFFDVNSRGMAEYLMRGSIFAIVFSFLQGSCSAIRHRMAYLLELCTYH